MTLLAQGDDEYNECLLKWRPSNPASSDDLPRQHVHDALVGSGWTQGQPVVVGASGGVDSTVLLHVLGALGVPSVVAHVNHHARGEASQGDAAFVAELAERFGWPFEELHLEAEELKQARKGFKARLTRPDRRGLRRFDMPTAPTPC